MELEGTLGPTQDFVDGYCEDDEDDEVQEVIWGRLFPLSRNFTSQELTNDEYTFGRDKGCDYCFDTSLGRKSPNFVAISKVHFRIYRQPDPSNPAESLMFVQDKSSNGTFLNGDKIGIARNALGMNLWSVTAVVVVRRNKTHVLNNNDEIALSHKKNKAFIFHDPTCVNSHDMPEEMKEKYSMSKTLGRGACGEVKLAFRKGTCEKFAVKIITKKTFSIGPHVGPAVMEEVKILKELQHPCVIGIEDVYDAPEALYIILELMEGGELFDRLVSQGRFDEPTAKLYFYQMLQAVKYLHDRGITHRDIKPENVLLASDAGESLVKVTDFGLSRFVGEQSLMKTLCGTPSYLAPEVLTSAGTGGYTKAVDCWSLGVILYISLAGYPPFSDEITTHTLHDQITKGIYSFPEKYWSSISEAAQDLVRKLLTVKPRDRITCDEALQHPWMQDQNVIGRAKKLMSGTNDMPPPPVPVKRPAEVGECSKPKRQSTDTAEDDAIEFV